MIHLDGDEWAMHAVMDVCEWFTGSNVCDFAGRGSIMGNADAQTILQENRSKGFEPLDPLSHDLCASRLDKRDLQEKIRFM